MAVEIKEIWHKSAAQELADPPHFPTLKPMATKDVTSEVQCGAEWDPREGPLLTVYPEDPYPCPECGAKLYFACEIKVWAYKAALPKSSPCCSCYDEDDDLRMWMPCSCLCHADLDKPEEPVLESSSRDGDTDAK